MVLYRSNININDVLGDYALTLVDALDTLAVSTCICLFKWVARHDNWGNMFPFFNKLV